MTLPKEGIMTNTFKSGVPIGGTCKIERLIISSTLLHPFAEPCTCVHCAHHRNAAHDLAEYLKAKDMLPADAEFAWFTAWGQSLAGNESVLVEDAEVVFERFVPKEKD